MSTTQRLPTPLAERILPVIGTFRGYNSEKARKDLIAAVTVALFTIPQAMAYALIAGFPPSMGIMTAIVPRSSKQRSVALNF